MKALKSTIRAGEAIMGKIKMAEIKVIIVHVHMEGCPQITPTTMITPDNEDAGRQHAAENS